MTQAAAPAPGTARTYLRIDRLTKKFGVFTALDNVSLEVYEGEFICFLGPSGCGKTTFLRAIAGLDIQTSGTVEQDGRDISALPPAERDFGIVFQSYALFPNLTAHKNIAFGLENQKLEKSKIAARVAELLELVGLPEQGRSRAPLVDVLEEDLTQFLNRAGRKTLSDDDRLEKELVKVARKTTQDEIGKKPEVTVIVSRLS